MRVLAGQCVEPGAEGLPLAPLMDVLRALARTMPPDQLGQVLGPARPGFARLLPELARGEQPAAGEDLQKAQLLEHVLGVLSRLSSAQPVLLIIEDLHWADRSTLDLVAFLIRSLRGSRVVLVITFRSDELDRRHPLRPLLIGWERVRPVRRIELRRFGREEAAAQLRAILGTDCSPVVADVVFGRSDGNAYLIEELAGVIQAGGDLAHLPPSLKDVLLSRTDPLSADAQQLLRIVSVAGGIVPERLLAEVAGTGKTELFSALREAVDNHLLVVDPAGHGYQFRHALTRDAVYEDMLPGERVELHDAYAGALDGDHSLAGDEAAVPATLAYHWYAALDLPRALEAAIDAATRAAASYAPAEELVHLERALEVWRRVPDAERRTGLDRAEGSRLAADAAYRCGALERARSLLASALAELTPGKDAERQALLLWQDARAQTELGAPDLAAGTLRKALALLPATEATRAHAVVLAALATAYGRGNAVAEAEEAARRAVEAARRAQAPEVEADAAVSLGVASYLLHPSETDRALEMLGAGLELARKMDFRFAALRGMVNLSQVLHVLGRHTEAVQIAAEGHKLAVRAGMDRTLGGYLANNQAEAMLCLGQWAEADRVTAEALAVMPEGLPCAELRNVRAQLAAMRGQYQEAGRELSTARQDMGSVSDYQFTQPSRYVEALIALGQGDLAAVRDAVSEGARLAAADLLVAQYTWPLIWLGMRTEADQAGRLRARHQEIPGQLTRRCAELARVAADLPAPLPFPELRAYQSLVTAEQQRAAGKVDVVTWASAVAAWRAAGSRHQLSYALLRLAEDCLASDRDQAADAVREAYAIASKLGATPAAEEAAAIARRARISLDSGQASQPEDELARFGLRPRAGGPAAGCRRALKPADR